MTAPVLAAVLAAALLGAAPAQPPAVAEGGWTCIVGVLLSPGWLDPAVTEGRATDRDPAVAEARAEAAACAARPVERLELPCPDETHWERTAQTSCAAGPCTARVWLQPRTAASAAAVGRGPDEEAACEAARQAACARLRTGPASPSPGDIQTVHRWPFPRAIDPAAGRAVCAVIVGPAAPEEEREARGTSARSADEARERAWAALREGLPAAERDLLVPDASPPADPLFGGRPAAPPPGAEPPDGVRWQVRRTSSTFRLAEGRSQWEVALTAARVAPRGRGLGQGADPAAACEAARRAACERSGAPPDCAAGPDHVVETAVEALLGE